MSSTNKNTFWVLVAGVVVGIILGAATTRAHAATTSINTLQIVDSTYLANGTELFKVYDNNNGAVCYAVINTWSSEGPGVSCFKN